MGKNALPRTETGILQASELGRGSRGRCSHTTERKIFITPDEERTRDAVEIEGRER